MKKSLTYSHYLHLTKFSLSFQLQIMSTHALFKFKYHLIISHYFYTLPNIYVYLNCYLYLFLYFYLFQRLNHLVNGALTSSSLLSSWFTPSDTLLSELLVSLVLESYQELGKRWSLEGGGLWSLGQKMSSSSAELLGTEIGGSCVLHQSSYGYIQALLERFWLFPINFFQRISKDIASVRIIDSRTFVGF